MTKSYLWLFGPAVYETYRSTPEYRGSKLCVTRFQLQKPVRPVETTSLTTHSYNYKNLAQEH